MKRIKIVRMWVEHNPAREGTTRGSYNGYLIWKQPCTWPFWTKRYSPPLEAATMKDCLLQLKAYAENVQKDVWTPVLEVDYPFTLVRKAE